MDSETGLRACCGVVVIDDRNRVLFTRRSGEGSRGVPGGGLKVGETWQQAPRRKYQEETGWIIDLLDLLGLFSDPSAQALAHRVRTPARSGALIWFPSWSRDHGDFVLGFLVAGPGCDLSEETAVGIGPSALDCRVAPVCPPGPVSPAPRVLASWSIRL
jgi:8-oxo-dGTP pyrophosphatase MutT (NUDIX family)